MRTERPGIPKRCPELLLGHAGAVGCMTLFWLLTAIPATVTAPPTAAEALRAHCAAREATVTLRAQCVQVKVFENLGEEDRSSGVLYYRKPDAVRWQYSEPDTSWTVLQGDKGWSVFPRIRQVQKFDLQRSQAEA